MLLSIKIEGASCDRYTPVLHNCPVEGCKRLLRCDISTGPRRWTGKDMRDNDSVFLDDHNVVCPEHGHAIVGTGELLPDFTVTMEQIKA